MVNLYGGVPGSGKTYRIVYDVNEECLKSPKKYKHIFTNINGLDYKKLNEIANEPDYVQLFEFLDLKREMIQEYDYHQISKNGELPEHVTDYDDFIKSEGIYKKYINSLIVIDECHLYFESKSDDVLIRFLSYHRHFDIDIYLVTQNKNLIDKKYLSFIETMYIALPASKRFFSFNLFGLNLVKFRYRKYASYQEYHANIMGTESVTFKKEIYALYNSGGNTIGKSASGQFLLPVLIMLAVTLFGYKLVMSRFSKTETLPVDNNVTEQHKTLPHEKQKNIQALAPVGDKDFYKFDCFVNSCINDSINTSFDQSTMMIFVNKFNCQILVNEIVDRNFNSYILECDSKFSNLLKLYSKKQIKENTNEKSVTSSINPFKRD